jgi:iron complex outermembrane receptor protein
MSTPSAGIMRITVLPVPTLALPFLLLARIACAQAAPIESELQEIVVTAEKRASTVQDTPISITAVSGDEILARGVTDFAALAQSIPGMSMRTSGPGQTEFEMRGMSSTGGNSPTVGFYFEDTPLTAPAASANGKVVIDPNLYDLSRVEVLRGPQGTLYGSGSMGGTVRIIPNQPNPQAFDTSAEAVISSTAGGALNRAENAMLNIPMGGSAAVRLVASDSHTSGWIDRIVIADGRFPLETSDNTVRGDLLSAPVAENYKNVNDEQLASVRASLLWKPTDRLAIKPSFLYQDLRQGGLSDIDSDPGTDAHYQPFDTPEPLSDRFELRSLNIQYQLDSFDVNSTTSYWNREEQLRQDASEEWQSAFGLPSYYVAQGGLGPDVPTPLEDDRSQQVSEEIRFTSSAKSDLQWLLGYFYSDFRSDWNLFIDFPAATPLFGTANVYSQTQPTKLLQQSVFGEISYRLTSQLRATVGLRRYSYSSSVQTATSGVAGPTGSNAVFDSGAGERSQGLNPKADLAYQPDPNQMLYATAAKGFRPGGGNALVPTSGTLGAACEENLQTLHGTTGFVPSPLTFGPDNVWSYELGEKLKTLEHRLTIDSAVYFEDWNDVQQNVPLPCGYIFNANTGTAHAYGTEIEVTSLLVPGLELSVNGGFTHASVVTASLPGIGRGARVQDVPNFTTAAWLAYSRPIGEALSFKARIENDYVGSRTDVTYVVNNLPAYDLASMRVGVAANKWSAMVFVSNVLNKRALLSNTQQVSINVPMYNRVAVAQPLTAGIDFSYRFAE